MAPWPGCPGNGGANSVPEPSTLVLFAAAGGGILLLKRYGKINKQIFLYPGCHLKSYPATRAIHIVLRARGMRS